jgi:hypothetical protein
MPVAIHWILAGLIGMSLGMVVEGLIAADKILKLQASLAEALRAKAMSERLLVEEKARVGSIHEARKQRREAAGMISGIEEIEDRGA